MYKLRLFIIIVRCYSLNSRIAASVYLSFRSVFADPLLVNGADTGAWYLRKRTMACVNVITCDSVRITNLRFTHMMFRRESIKMVFIAWKTFPRARVSYPATVCS